MFIRDGDDDFFIHRLIRVLRLFLSGIMCGGESISAAFLHALAAAFRDFWTYQLDFRRVRLTAFGSDIGFRCQSMSHR